MTATVRLNRTGDGAYVYAPKGEQAPHYRVERGYLAESDVLGAERELGWVVVLIRPHAVGYNSVLLSDHPTLAEAREAIAALEADGTR